MAHHSLSRSLRVSKSTKTAALAANRNIPVWQAVAIGMILWFVVMSFGSVARGQDDDSNQEGVSTKSDSSETVAFDFFGSEAPLDIDQLREMQAHFQELSQEVSDATVCVRVGQSSGTGVIVTRDGYVMTAAHVIGGANRNAQIVLPNGDTLKAKTLGLNRTVDSGLLKITDDKMKKFPYLSPGVSEDLKDGQWVMAIGHPGGWDEDRGLVFRIGRILRKSDSTISTDCTLVGGDSGGPLVDMNGDVIGIHSRIGLRLTDNIHVPVDVFSNEWDDLASGKDWGRGIGGSNPANDPWWGLSLDGDDSLVIDQVVAGGPAEKAGLKSGDLLLEIDGEKIRNRIRFRGFIRGQQPGAKVKVKVKRGGEEKEIELTVGSQADRRR